jgi:K+-transporting ATPase ATPase A chain
MTTPYILSDSVMLILFLVLVTVVAFPFSSFIVHVFDGSLSRGILGHFERVIYRLRDTDPDKEEGWRGYSRDMLIFNGIGFVILVLILLLQGFLPPQPTKIRGF